MNPLQAISPIDGRYRRTAEPLADFFSEEALIKYRIRVESEYLIALAGTPGLGLRRLSSREKNVLRKLANSPGAAALIKRFETKGAARKPATNHDVKAVEYFIKEKIRRGSLRNMLEWVHFGLTSEDVNNLAYALMLSDALEQVILPAVQEVQESLDGLARKHAGLPMLARTHGQPASPTTFGKEFRVWHARIAKRLGWLSTATVQVKLNGASGNWNAHVAAYPKVDWMKFSRKFIESFNSGRQHKLEPNMATTQIEWHDSYVAIFDTLRRVNMVLTDMCQDVWRYVSDGWLVQKPKRGEVGSSTMPHKVNPIDFENAEGNLGLANSFFEFFARKLPISRLQRDLSDSTVERSFGTALAHCLIAYKSILKGLGKVRVNEPKVREELRAHPEVLAEAIQTILRREGAKMPYEELKKLTRGKEVAMEDIAGFIDGLRVGDAVKKELKALTPEKYVGLAARVARGKI